jgi:hypothetical protein
VVDGRDGTYAVSGQGLTVAGEYELSVTFGGLHAARSPLAVTVVPSAPDPARSVAHMGILQKRRAFPSPAASPNPAVGEMPRAAAGGGHRAESKRAPARAGDETAAEDKTYLAVVADHGTGTLPELRKPAEAAAAAVGLEARTGASLSFTVSLYDRFGNACRDSNGVVRTSGGDMFPVGEANK